MQSLLSVLAPEFRLHSLNAQPLGPPTHPFSSFHSQQMERVGPPERCQPKLMVLSRRKSLCVIRACSYATHEVVCGHAAQDGPHNIEDDHGICGLTTTPLVAAGTVTRNYMSRERLAGNMLTK